METMRCERSKEKWNKVKGSIKVHVDCRRREARMTRRGTNKAGEVEDEDILIISSDKEVQYNLYKWGGLGKANILILPHSPVITISTKGDFTDSLLTRIVYEYSLLNDSISSKETIMYNSVKISRIEFYHS